MKLSARNQIKGKVIAVDHGPISAKVKIDIGGDNILISHVTDESVTELNIKVGDEVTAVIKASSIIIGK